MGATLQRPCAKFRYMLARTIFGVWIFTVKARETAVDARKCPDGERAARPEKRLRFMSYADSFAL
jgi:hypothetical protein